MKKLFAALAVIFALTVLSSAASAALPTKPLDIPESGLRFRFDGDAEEASGALSGKLRGNPRFVEGRDGTPEGAIWFETEEQAVALQIDDIEGDWTAAFWVRVSGYPYHAFLCSSVTGSLRVIQDNGMVGATINGVVDNSVPYEIPRETWTMLTFAYDMNAEITSVYVNGEFVDAMFGEQTLAMTLLGDAPEQMGWQSAPEYALDDAWFFGRLLSDAEILTLYETDAVPPPEKTAEPAPENEPAEEPESDPEDAEEEDGDFDLTDPDDAAPDENAVRERKPGAFAAMGVIVLAAAFLICAGVRAIFRKE